MPPAETEVGYNRAVSATGEAAPRLTRLGRYELITRIGQGGMAEVQLALQRGPAGFEKLVVVKLVHESLATQKAFVDMLLDEARVAALVKHPNVVDIYDLGQADGRYFIAMEYLEGEPLLAVLRAGREGKRLDPLSTSRLIADTAEGLDAAHELRSMSGEALELVHHDISLGNIVVLYNGQVKLVDFGVAKATQSASTKAKVQGKFSYMAPEKLRGASGDRRSDIFSLGCVMWEALTLKRLFKGGSDAETMNQILEMRIQPPSQVNGDVPAELDPIVMRALARDPAKRQATAKQLGVELEEVLRTRGYGAKNDRVAKYMQETFKSHIDARKKLVQEVVSKGSASREVVDAAFSPMLGTGSPVPAVGGEFVSASAAGSGALRPPMLPKVAPARLVESSGVPLPGNTFSDSSKPTVISAPLFEVAADEEFGTQQSKIIPTSDAARFWQNPRKIAMAGSSAGVFLMMITVIVIAASRSTGSPSDVKPLVEEHQTIDAGTVAGSPPVAITPDASTDASRSGGSAVMPPEIVIDNPEDSTGKSVVTHTNGSGSGVPAHTNGSGDHTIVRKPPAPVDKPSAEALFKQGLQAFVKGDTKGALAILQKAKAAGPGYPPSWRLLGQVYKKLGDRNAAKASFQRYLKLDPKASDADKVTTWIDEL
ncbi:MAG: serine/threonine protein kinase with repeat [Myxococcales bacterium]|nr:serine/threonine protein kinase with repeat [Myxococcales bacterium]